MKDYTQYKRIIKFLSSAVIVFLEAAIYGYVWIFYYNKIMQYPFWRRGNWLMIAVYVILLLFFEQMYGGFKIGFYKTWNVIYSQILSLALVNILTYLQIALLDKKFHSLTIMGTVMLIEAIVAVLWAWIFQSIYSRIFPQRRLLLVYGEYPMFHLMQKISTREDKYQICNVIHYEQGMEMIAGLIHNYDGVIIGDIPAHERNLILKRCFGEGIRTYTVPKISDVINRSSDDLNLFDTPLLLSRNEDFKIEQAFGKRMADLVFSAFGLLITSPFFVLIAFMIKATDGGPVFYKQTRLTKDKKEFMIYKFRTMIQDAEKDGRAHMAMEGDERILPVGRFLRATRLDELPQLINILRGEMSMVGPRPERPELAEEIEKELPEFAYRLKVKAGLTGYAQIYGKYNTTAYDKLKLDLTYIRNYSFFLDLKLMIMTPKIMLMKESTEGVLDEDKRLEQQEAAAAKIEIKL
ncbi:MAG: sugar transferase [Lachnospiraceae bacterium]|jgi:exopolysaccharide biosynthesis polyprenyl glycosylphosphotransferase|nr:sugar transferase [Lachnospiraceae bacterium]NBJ83241.1 sugar transferase [bacterium 1XD42-76]NBK06654.1 sugar transferase [bacterium 1XD42-94]